MFLSKFSMRPETSWYKSACIRLDACIFLSLRFFFERNLSRLCCLLKYVSVCEQFHEKSVST